MTHELNIDSFFSISLVGEQKVVDVAIRNIVCTRSPQWGAWNEVGLQAGVRGQEATTYKEQLPGSA